MLLSHSIEIAQTKYEVSCKVLHSNNRTIPCLHTSVPLSAFSAMSLSALQTVTKDDELVTCTQHGGFGRARKQARAGESSARAARSMKLR